MINRHIFLFIILGAGVAILIAPFDLAKPGILGLTVTLIIVLTLTALLFEFESSIGSSKEVALVAMLGTVSGVLRIPFAAIPGVQPCTYLIICAGYVFGPVTGFMVGALTPLISNFFLGHGPWTPYQMFAWGAAGLSAAFLSRLNLKKRELILFSFCWGYLYSILMNLWFWASFIYPLTPTTFITTLGRSIWFDTFHAVGNAVFMGLLGTKTVRIFERFEKRFRVKIIKTPPKTSTLRVGLTK